MKRLQTLTADAGKQVPAGLWLQMKAVRVATGQLQVTRKWLLQADPGNQVQHKPGSDSIGCTSVSGGFRSYVC
jgi:hypothetical protein